MMTKPRKQFGMPLVLDIDISIQHRGIRMSAVSEVDFAISDTDMDVLKKAKRIKNYGEASRFPVYGGKLNPDGTRTPQDA